MTTLDSAWFQAQVCDIMSGNRMSDAEVDRRMNAIGLRGWRSWRLADGRYAVEQPSASCAAEET